MRPPVSLRAAFAALDVIASVMAAGARIGAALACLVLGHDVEEFRAEVRPVGSGAPSVSRSFAWCRRCKWRSWK